MYRISAADWLKHRETTEVDTLPQRRCPKKNLVGWYQEEYEILTFT